MRQKYWTRISRVLLVLSVIGIVSYIPSIASATCVGNQQSCSTNYGVGQAIFNSGGVNQCPLKTSGTYCANVSVGDLTDGGTTGTSYQAKTGSGFVTNREPYIQFSIGGVATDLGTLTPSKLATFNANFTILTYLAGSYIVQVSAKPPTDATGYTIATPGVPTTPAAGTEVFGMNLISNSSNPSGGVTPYGANPVCNADPTGNSFCPGGALASSIMPNYSHNNQYYYPGSGSSYTDTVVRSNTSTGSVSYTLSYVYGIGNTTPTGFYTYNGMFIATSTY